VGHPHNKFSIWVLFPRTGDQQWVIPQTSVHQKRSKNADGDCRHQGLGERKWQK